LAVAGAQATCTGSRRATRPADDGPASSERRRAFAAFNLQVEAYSQAWSEVAGEVGLPLLRDLLACHAATFTRRWWLSIGWLQVGEEFIQRINGPDAMESAADRQSMRHCCV
jgi:hypothetical protein